MAVTLTDVDHVARLARIGLTESEREGLRAELEAILAYVDQLQTLDTKDVEPTASVVSFSPQLRDDRVTNPEAVDAMLANSRRDGDHISVPKIIEDAGGGG